MFAKAAGGNWSAAATWASTDGGVDSVGPPTAADSALFSNLSGNVVQDLATGAVCLDLDFTRGTGYTGTFSSTDTGRPITVSGNIKFNGAMTLTYTSRLTMNATSGTKTITSNGKTWPGFLTLNGGGGTFQLADNLTMSGNSTTTTIQNSNGTFDPNGKKVTFTANGGNCGVAGNDLTFFDFEVSNASSITAMNLGCNVTVTGTLKSLGASDIAHIVWQSSVVGTSRTLTVNAVDAASNRTDFMDVAFAGTAAPYATGARIGNRQGCSGITFTASATQTGNGTTSFSWSNAARWSGSPARVPLAQDDVVISNAFSASQTLTFDATCLGRSITFSHTGTLSLNNAVGALNLFGSLTISGGVFTGNQAPNNMNFRGRTACTLTSGGQILGSTITLTAPGGSLTLQDSLSEGTIGGVGSSSVNIANGTFDANNQNVTLGNSTSVGSIACQPGATINYGTGTWTINKPDSSSSSVLFGGGGTHNASTATIKINITGGGCAIFQPPNGQTYGTLWITGSGIGYARYQTGTGQTFTTFRVDSGAGMVLLGGQTYTAPTWTMGGQTPGGSDARYARTFGANALASDTISTPDAAANRITGDIALVARVAMASWTPPALQSIIDKWNGGGSLAYNFEQSNSGKLQFTYTQGGLTRTDAATVNTSTVFADGAAGWVAVSHNTTSGVTKFWTSTDGAAWTQLGADVAGTAGAMTDFATTLNMGMSVTTPGSSAARWCDARLFRGKVFSGIPPMLGGAGSANPVADFNPADYVSGGGSTWASSATGETWSLGGAVIVSGTNFCWLNSSVAASNATVSKSGGGHVSCDYISLRRVTAIPSGSPDQTFFATNSIDGGNNTGWNFYGYTYTLALDAMLFTWGPIASGFYRDRILTLDPLLFTWSLVPMSFDAVHLFSDPRFIVSKSGSRTISGSTDRAVRGSSQRTIYLRDDD